MNKGFNQKKASEELIAWTAKHDTKSLIKILQRNGVNIKDNASVNEVNIATLAALRSKSFMRDLSLLLSKNAVEHAAVFTTDRKVNVGGPEELNNLSGANDPAPGAPTNATTNSPSSTTTSSGSNVGGFLKANVLTKENINAFLTTGLNALNTSFANKNESMKQKTAELQYMQQTAYQTPAGAPPPAAAKSNTMTYVLIGVGVVAVGFGLYFALRKKK